jgi:hypothetical protein
MVDHSFIHGTSATRRWLDAHTCFQVQHPHLPLWLKHWLPELIGRRAQLQQAIKPVPPISKKPFVRSRGLSLHESTVFK